MQTQLIVHQALYLKDFYDLLSFAVSVNFVQSWLYYEMD